MRLVLHVPSQAYMPPNSDLNAKEKQQLQQQTKKLAAKKNNNINDNSYKVLYV